MITNLPSGSIMVELRGQEQMGSGGKRIEGEGVYVYMSYIYYAG